jgi:hypothetical protein
MDNKINCTNKGGKKPYAHLLPMMALVLFGMIALVGVAAADNSYTGAEPVTKLSGTVNGGVNVTLGPDPWNNTTPTTRTEQISWSNLSIDNPSQIKMEFARLYVMVYGGNMTAKATSPDFYTGNLTVQLYNGSSTLGNPLANSQPLNLDYDRATGAAYNTSFNESTDPLVNLSRTTSDYIAVFDIKNNISNLSSDVLGVKVSTWNSSGKFDGRVKAVQLAYGWNVNGTGTTTKYWINEGSDPITKYATPYPFYNTTEFNGVGTNTSAKLWIGILNNATANDGLYKWNNNAFNPTEIEPSGKYSGLTYKSWSTTLTPFMSNNSVLSYNNGTNAYYKIGFAVLATT